MTSRTRRHIARVNVLLLLWPTMLALMCSRSTIAQADPAGMRRDGWPIVRLTTAYRRQLDQVLALPGVEPLNCVIAPGVQEFCVSPTALGQIRAMGMNVAVLQRDAQAMIDAERARLFSPENQNIGFDAGEGIAGAPPAWFNEYKTYAQFSDYLDGLVALRPDLATKLAIATTIEGRTIYGLRVTSPVGTNKPAVLYSGCQHAREWAAAMTTMFIADTLVRDYGSDARVTALLDQAEFFIIPVMNPDGFEFTYGTPPNGDRLWRKNRRDNGNATFGVDLNRNWGVDWGGPNSTSALGSSDVYFGTSAFSEPETAGVRDFIVAHPRLVAHIDIHSFGQLVLQAWGYTNAENPQQDLIDDVGTRMN